MPQPIPFIDLTFLEPVAKHIAGAVVDAVAALVDAVAAARDERREAQQRVSGSEDKEVFSI